MKYSILKWSLPFQAAFYAVMYKQDEILEFLINKGASLDKEDKYKNSIKELAKVKNHEPTLNILQKYSPEPTVEEDDFMIENMKDWKEMFPGILPSNK